MKNQPVTILKPKNEASEKLTGLCSEGDCFLVCLSINVFEKKAKQILIKQSVLLTVSTGMSASRTADSHQDSREQGNTACQKGDRWSCACKNEAKIVLEFFVLEIKEEQVDWVANWPALSVVFLLADKPKRVIVVGDQFVIIQEAEWLILKI